MLKFYPKTDILIRCLSVIAALILSACSGGSSSDSSDQISGSAIKGIISSGIVRAYDLDDGEPRYISSTRTRADGSFSLSVPDSNHSLLLLELRADAQTRMVCDLQPGCTDPVTGSFVNVGEQISLNESFRLLGTRSPSAPNKAFLTPLSHLILSAAASLPGGITTESIEQASLWLMQDLQLETNPLDNALPDLSQYESLANISNDVLYQALLGASLLETSLSANWSAYLITIEDINLLELLETTADQAGQLSNHLPSAQTQAAMQLSTIASDAQETANELTAAELTILSHPQSLTATEGDSIILRVATAGTGNISMQWYHDDVAIAGANSSTLTIENATTDDEGLYYAVVWNGVRSETSLSALVRINEQSSAPGIISQPSSQTLTEGEPLELSVVAQGSGNLSYIWQKNGSVLPGAQQASLTIASVTTNDAGSYRVIVSNAYGDTASNYAQVNVTSATAPVSIITQPSSQSIVETLPVTFSVDVTGGGYISYQWRKDGNPIDAANNDSFTINSVNASDAGNYDVVISNSQGSLVSDSAALEVISSQLALSVTSHPSSQTLNTGDTLTLSVQAMGQGELSYQWFKDETLLSGEVDSSLVIASASTADSGLYYVRVSDQNQSVNSLSALVTVSALYTLELSWDIPTERENGDALPLEEISAYTLRYGTNEDSLSNVISISGGATTQYLLSDLSAGQLYLQIATVDSDGIQGAYSDTLSVFIE